jgi:hypothetical protein
MGLVPLWRWYKRCRVDGRKLLNIQQPRQSKAAIDDEDVIHGGNSTTSIFHATN